MRRFYAAPIAFVIALLVFVLSSSSDERPAMKKASAQSGGSQVTGTIAPGTVPVTPIKPVINGGLDPTGGAVRTQAIDASGNVQVDLRSGATAITDANGMKVHGPAAEGAAAVAGPVRAGGWDGTNVLTFKVDASGRQLAVGAAAEGAAVAGNPLRVSGWDGTNAFTLKTDATGQLKITGAETAGSAVTGTGVRSMGSDGTNARDFLTDTAGRHTLGDTSKTGYSSSDVGFAPAATATDVFTITGSASKTIRVRRVAFTATQTTAGTFTFVLVKRSTADTGGTSTNLVEVPNDSSNAAATATCLSYTANPTTGSLVGNIAALKAFVPATATAASAPVYAFEFGLDGIRQPVVLRGTGEVLALNLNGVTLTGGSIAAFVEWTEE